MQEQEEGSDEVVSVRFEFITKGLYGLPSHQTLDYECESASRMKCE